MMFRQEERPGWLTLRRDEGTIATVRRPWKSKGMRLRDIGKWIRSRWLLVAAAVVLVAFVAGLAFGLSGADRTVAQGGSTDLPYPDKVATPDGPIPTMDLTKYPIIAEKDPYTAPVERMEPKSDAGSSTKPVTGNYLYLPKIGRYYSLPDDVKLIHNIEFVSCIPEEPCPDTPFLIYQRGEAIIGIDQMGQIFDDIGEDADASAFPFFTGKEEEGHGAGQTMAREQPTDLPYPDKVATPDGPIPTVDRTKRPLIFETVPYTLPVERMEPKSDAGSSTKPTTGNYLYLPLIDLYYSLPDDVKRVEKITLGTCIPGAPCPVFPLLIYQRGEARIGIDQVGEIFETVHNADASAFPFFTGEEDQPVSNGEHSGRAPVIRQYDVNNSGMIEQSEAMAAVSDYFAGLISKDEALAVVAAHTSH